MDTLKILFDDLASGAIVLEDYQNKISDPDVVQDCREWIQSLKSTHNGEICDITPHMFLIIPIIVHHLDTIVGDPTSKPHQKIYSQALHTLDVFETSHANNTMDSKGLLHALHNFSRHFRVWKKVDSFKVVEEYAKLYWELEVQKVAIQQFESESSPTNKTKNQEETTSKETTSKETTSKDTKNDIEDSLKEMTARQEKIKEAIVESVGPEGLIQLQQYTPVMMDNSALDSLTSRVAETYQQAYWDTFRDSILKREWSYFAKLLEEIMFRFQAMIPKRKDVQAELADRLSWDTNDVGPTLIQARDWAGYMVEMMEHFQAPDSEKDRTDFWNGLQTTAPFQENEFVGIQDEDWRGDFFTLLFKWVMTRQDQIFQQIHNFKNKTATTTTI